MKSKERIKLGVCGTGAFADSFIPLFKAHPLVREVVLCDLDAAKLKAKSAQFDIPRTCPSLDELCQTDVDAIAIFTQHHLHGSQAIQALRAGKHVYSAVPSAISVAEMRELVRTVEATSLTYMVGETSYYYPSTLYCRQRFQRGDFGHIVYGEGEYYHDYRHGLLDVMRWRFGKPWKRHYGMPPFFYPTHATAPIISVTGAHVTHVSALGFEDRHPDRLYARKDNVWKNPFSNESMLCRMSDGSMARFNVFWRIGHPGREGLSLYGTEGCYEEQVGRQIWVTVDPRKCEDVTELLRCRNVPAKHRGVQMKKITDRAITHVDVSAVHPVDRLPKEFLGLPNGHAGSHQFLVHDFVTACVTGQTPPNNVWAAARYLLPGLIGHQSALQGGALLAVPDFPPPRSREKHLNQPRCTGR